MKKVTNFDIKAMVKAEAENLEKLQRNLRKANKKRKPYWQKRIDAHFGLA